MQTINLLARIRTAFTSCSEVTTRKAREKHFSAPRPTVLRWQSLCHSLSNDNQSSVKAHKLAVLYSPAVSQYHDTPTARREKEKLLLLSTHGSKTQEVGK